MKPTRRISPGIYFVTAAASGHRNLFQSDRMARLLLDTILHYRDVGAFQLHAFVIMPNHIHLLLTPRESVERALQLIKGGFSYRASHELGFNGEVWKRGFTDHRVRDAGDLAHHKLYIHHNPVRRHLVLQASDYPFPSAFRPSAS